MIYPGRITPPLLDVAVLCACAIPRIIASPAPSEMRALRVTLARAREAGLRVAAFSGS